MNKQWFCFLRTQTIQIRARYFQSFSISSSTVAGVDDFNQSTDLVLNTVDREITEFSIDAKSPEVTISLQLQRMMAKYLYGNDIKIVAGATDDVAVVSMQMRFVQNYGTSSSVTEPWRNVSGITINDDGDWTIEMVFSSGNFLPGLHEVSVKAIDSAGNERTSKIQFVTDWCRHRLSDGSTVCEYSNPVPEDPETVYPELNATDPPYMIAWITAGVSFLAVIVSLFVISSAMSGPKKKKDDDDDVGDDWIVNSLVHHLNQIWQKLQVLRQPALKSKPLLLRTKRMIHSQSMLYKPRGVTRRRPTMATMMTTMTTTTMKSRRSANVVQV